MNIRLAALAAVCSWLSSVSAQVAVEVVLSQDKFLPREELLAGVRVVNRSGQTLRLGEQTNWIRFTIERAEGGLVRKLSDPPVQRPFELESAKQATLKVDLAPCYDLHQKGAYQITAEVMIKDWGKRLRTKPKSFEIIEGTKIWERSFGVPKAQENGPPELRSYCLQQANYLAEPRLYLRVSKSDGTVIQLINVGRMLSFGRPEPLLDKRSRLHLLHQNGPRSCTYLVVNPDGEIEIRQLFEFTDVRARLRMDADGAVRVESGVRRASADDLPVEVEKKRDDGQDSTH